MTRPHSAFIFVLGHVIYMCMTVSFYSITLNLIIQNSLATLDCLETWGLRNPPYHVVVASSKLENTTRLVKKEFLT